MPGLIALVEKPLDNTWQSPLEPPGSPFFHSTPSHRLSPEPRCSPPSSHSFSTLVSSASTRRPTRPPTALPVFRQNQKQGRQERTSAEPAPTRPHNVKMPTVSAGPNRTESGKKVVEIGSVVVFTVNSLSDWCIYAPPEPGPDSLIGNTEVRQVSRVSERRAQLMAHFPAD